MLAIIYNILVHKNSVKHKNETYVSSSVSGIFVYGKMATTRFLSLTGSGGGTGCISLSLLSKSEEWV